MKDIGSFLIQNKGVVALALVSLVAILAAIGAGILLFVRSFPRRARMWIAIVAPLAVLGAASYAALHFYATRPETARTKPKSPVKLVNVVVAKVGSHKVSVPAMATVVAARTVVLKSQVRGRIIEQCPQMLLGGLCKKGDVLLRIDPREYEFAVDQAQAAVDQAQSELSLEEGRQVIAKSEWALLGAEVPRSEASRKLALREPQLTAARARLSAARSRLDLAKLNLERTTIRAPFNAKVVEGGADLKMELKAEVGQVVDGSTSLARLIGTDKFWLRASLPVGRLQLIRLPGSDGKGGADVKIILGAGNGRDVVRQGRVIRLLGDTDSRSLMARMLIEVDDPLALEDVHLVPLLAGGRVRVEIDAIPIEGVVKVSRAALREGDRVWIMDAKDKLDVRRVKVAWRAKDSVLVHTFDKGTGIRDGERIVTSLLSMAKRGADLKIEGKGKSRSRSKGKDGE